VILHDPAGKKPEIPNLNTHRYTNFEPALDALRGCFQERSAHVPDFGLNQRR
jgi:hypothetical protein